MSVYRPKGIIIMSVIFMIIAALGIILAIDYETTAIPQYYQMIELLYCMILLNLGSYNVYSILTIYGLYIYQLSSNIPLWQIEAVIALIFFETGIAISIGLLRMKRWGYYLAWIFGILGIFVGAIGLIIIVGIFLLIFAIATVMYLSASDAKYYFEPTERALSPQSGVRTPVEESEPKTRKTYRWQREGAGEEPKVSTSIPKRLPKEKPPTSTAEKNTESGDLGEELEATRAKYEKTGTRVETMEKTEKETPPKKQITIPDKKVERLKDLESEEEATQVLLEELKGRWTDGKIDIDIYQKLKEKYEKKIEYIEKQKKKN